MQIQELMQANTYFQTGLILVSCLVGSIYGAYNLKEALCVKLFNAVLGFLLGFLSVLEYSDELSLAVTCVIGLVISGSGALIYAIVLAVLPNLISEQITKKITDILGSKDKP